MKDVYLGMCYLEPYEKERKIGPGKKHEEILILLNGKVRINYKDGMVEISEGETFFMPDGHKIRLTTMSNEQVFLIIAGGHTKHHTH